uniref:DDE-1 domain-containing protein n=1 Tax=Ciona savignyi TaxID=51511 RepID=H2YBW1_CIOSA
SVRSSALQHNVNRTTLSRYVKDAKSTGLNDPDVFQDFEEEELASYIIQCSKMFHGLTRIDCRRLAFQYAQSNKKKIPSSWAEKEIAGKDWFLGFLALRMPEATSLARSISFNKYNVNLFFDNFESVMQRYKFQPHRIWNLDETGITTVQKPKRILAQKGLKQVGQISSSERGVLVTLCCCINAVGQALPPAYIFPRVHFKNYMLNGAPNGSLGLATQSGWMNTDLFVDTLLHFVKHMNSSKENPSVLVMDNHQSHLLYDVITLAREHGVNIVTFPPHCSHRMQPLDVSVYGPFKSHYNALLD